MGITSANRVFRLLEHSTPAHRASGPLLLFLAMVPGCSEPIHGNDAGGSGDAPREDATVEDTPPVDAPSRDDASGTVDGGAIACTGPLTEESVLGAMGAAPSDEFGYAVALSGDGTRALVGARYDDTAAGADAGSARIFVRMGTTWTEEATLLPSAAEAGAWFGFALALNSDGSRALVGAPNAGTDDAGSGVVFVRSGTTWTEEATLLAPDRAAGDNLGYAVALTGDGSRALVTAHRDDVAGIAEAGSARVFLRTGTIWAEEATLVASDGTANDQLGASGAVTSDGTRVLVGAWNDGAGAGSARVFFRTGTTWSEEATLAASDGAANDRFGVSVALTSDGRVALIGADRDDTAGGMDAGSVRVFSRTGTVWGEDTTLITSDGAAGDEFGYSVALSGDGSRALVGAVFDDTALGTDAGSARVFERAGWVATQTLAASDGAAGDWFGISVALSSDGDQALVGAVFDDTAGGTDAGSARAFACMAAGAP